MSNSHDNQQSSTLRAKLVEQLINSGVLKSHAVECALLQVPRELFVPESGGTKGLLGIYEDIPLVTKTDERGQTISTSSEPNVMVSMLQLLGSCEGKKILEIGTGTGYNAALLANLVGPSGQVVSMELDPELAERARVNLRALELNNRTRVVTGDGWLGCLDEAPFDCIIVTAQSDDIVPAWFEQLAEKGRLIVPLYLAPEFQCSTIVGFQRRGVLLESFHMIRGRFLGLRGQNTVHGPELYPYSIAVFLGASDREPTAQIHSTLLPHLDLAYRMELLSIWLAPGRVVALSEMIPSVFDFVFYLRLKKSKLGLCTVLVPPQHSIQNLGKTRLQGVGFARCESDQLGLLLLSWPTENKDETRDSVILYGANSDSLLNFFEGLVREWKALGCVGFKDLRVQACQGKWLDELSNSSWVLPLRSATLALEFTPLTGNQTSN